jgi:hypothetical protein
MEWVVDWKTWLVTMRLGEVRDCRPNLDIEKALELLKEREGKISPVKWPYYLGPTLTFVDSRYAECLSQTLDKVIFEMSDPTLGQSHFVGGSNSIMLTKLQLELIPLEQFKAIREMAAAGSFNVELMRSGMVRIWR